MPSCSIVGGCKYPGVDGGSHVCKFCGEMVHNMCLQALTGAEDKPEGGFVCGEDGLCRKDVGHTSGATSGLVEANLCAADRKCMGRKGVIPTIPKACCNRVCHLMCTRLGCIDCDPEDFMEGSEKILSTSISKGEAIDVEALASSTSSNAPSSALAKEQEDAGMLLSMSSAMQSTEATTSVKEATIVGVQSPSPALSTAKKSAANCKSVPATPTRESSRLRNAQAVRQESPPANSVAVDPVMATKIISASLNDAFGILFKSAPFLKVLGGLVKENTFEKAVESASEKLPINRTNLKRITDDNSVTVSGILTKALKPALLEATAGIEDATTTMEAVVETLKAAIDGETPVEVKRSGRKAKGKKGTKSALLIQSGEEGTLLTAKEVEQLVGVFNNTAKGTMKDTLCEGVCEGVRPHFAGLAGAVSGAIDNSIKTQRALAAEDKLEVQQQLGTVLKHLGDVTAVLGKVSADLGKVSADLGKASADLQEVQALSYQNAKNLRLLTQASDTTYDTRPISSASSAMSSRKAGKRAPPPTPYDPSLSDSSDGPPTPEIKRSKRHPRPASKATSETPLPSVDPVTTRMERQMEQLLDQQKHSKHMEQPANIARQVCSLLAANNQLQPQQPQVVLAQPTHPPQHQAVGLPHTPMHPPQLQAVGLPHTPLLHGGLGQPPVQQPSPYTYHQHFR